MRILSAGASFLFASAFLTDGTVKGDDLVSPTKKEGFLLPVFPPGRLLTFARQLPFSATPGFDPVGQPLLGVPTSTMENPFFGRVVHLSKNDGKRLLVGAPLHDYKTPHANETQINRYGGGVFLYELDESAQRWNMIWFLQGNEDEKFGREISLSGDGSRVAVRRNRGQMDFTEVYEINEQGATRLGDPIGCLGSGSGLALAPLGNRVAMSCENFDSGRGRVDVFDYDGENWKGNGAVVGPKTGIDFGWGTSFSNDGNRLAISAPGYSYDVPRRRCGLVQVWQLSGGSWTQRGGNLMGEVKYEKFGMSLDLSGDGRTVVVGSPENIADDKVNSGGTVRAYFDFRGVWLQTGSDITGFDKGDAFGESVSISDTGVRLAVSSPRSDASTGHIRVFNLNRGEWEQHGEAIEGIETGTRIGYGHSGVSLDGPGKRLAYGSPFCGLTGCVHVVNYAAVIDNPTTEKPETVPVTTQATPKSTAQPTSPPVETLKPTAAPTGGPTEVIPPEMPNHNDIAFVGANAIFDEEHPAMLQLQYKVSPQQAKIAVFQADCKTRPRTQLKSVRKTVESISPDKDAMEIDIEINLGHLEGIYTEPEIGTGFISLCVRVDLIDEDNKFLAFDQHIFMFELDTSANFEMRSLFVEETMEEVQVKTSVDYSVSACQCDDSFSCVNEPIKEDEDVLICIATNQDGVFVATVQDLQLFRGPHMQTFVHDGEEDDSTEILLQNGGAAVRTRLDSDFFQGDQSLAIHGRGSCTLSFVQDHSRVLQTESNELDFTFELLVTEDDNSASDLCSLGSSMILAMALVWSLM